MSESFRVSVTKDYLKFSAAHFIACPGFRERLHGHNYRVSIEIEGRLRACGYVVDFTTVKKIARRLCEKLNERLLLPAESKSLHIREDGHEVYVRYEEDEFRFPQGDVLLLPIAHTSVEELAAHLAREMHEDLLSEGVEGIRALEVGVEECFGQTAYFRKEF